MLNDTKSSSTLWSSVQNAAFWVLQIVDIRLALVIGLAAFMLAVGFDSSGNKAEAADLATGPSLVPVSVSVTATPSYAFAGQPLVRDAQLATARRLRHGSLTSAIMTSNRLTDAHFFIDLPSEQ
ncbi:hypothetical protein H6F75_20080 [Nodosilinea sp. FACHB-131]|uniref:hypothetical protein n=1 Tax=Cyanophyceae TaxID=3028117 RepID=UPI001682B54A|nr:hypothetical protein [Nodosilinea sp. FACHB-131]MBD1875786.1 hypothetical protein [Nodosilinea sp. FACHB-131]